MMTLCLSHIKNWIQKVYHVVSKLKLKNKSSSNEKDKNKMHFLHKVVSSFHALFEFYVVSGAS
jgi:hypothetical protein